MSKKTINKIITIFVVFIVLFLAGTFAYENYLIRKSDRDAQIKQEQEIPAIKDNSATGNVNNEEENKQK